MKLLFVIAALYYCSTGLSGQTEVSATQHEASWEQTKYWEEFNNVDGRFQLLTPAEFTHRVDSLETNIGVQALHTFHFEAPDPAKSENVIYALSYVDYPVGSLHHDSTDLVSEFLSSAEDEAAKIIRGELIYAADKEVSAYPARQWRVDYRDGQATARTLAAVAGNRYYELKVFSLKASGPNTAANKFFDSFRLFDPPSEQ